MKKFNKMKTIISVGLILGNMTAMSVPVTAATYRMNDGLALEEISPLYMAIFRLKSSLTINNAGKATCRVEVRSREGGTVDIAVELQQKVGSKWSTIIRWNDSGDDFDFSEIYYVKSGYDYGVKVSANAYDSSGRLVESPIVYSTTVSY